MWRKEKLRIFSHHWQFNYFEKHLSFKWVDALYLKEPFKGVKIIQNYNFISLKNHKGSTTIWIVKFVLK